MNRKADKSLQAAAILLAILCAGSPGAEAVPSPDLQGVGFDQRLDQPIPLDLPFTDESGKPVKLGDYFQEKPVILVLAYYRCPMLCTLVLNGTAQAMSKIPLSLGKDYRVLTVSFDPRETWQLAAAKRKTYVARYRDEGEGADWHFLTGESEAIGRLTQAVGFRYVYDAQNDQYLHASGIIVMTPEGRTSRYLYGVQFPARDLRLALVEASENKIGSPVDQVLLYCFHYDPAAGKYTATVMNFIRAGGLLSMVGVIGLVWFLRRRGRRRAAPARAGAGPPPSPRPPGEDPHEQ